MTAEKFYVNRPFPLPRCVEKVLLYDGKEAAKFNIHESEPNALVNGTWDSIGPPLADATKTSESAKKLLYVTGF